MPIKLRSRFGEVICWERPNEVSRFPLENRNSVEALGWKGEYRRVDTLRNPRVESLPPLWEPQLAHESIVIYTPLSPYPDFQDFGDVTIARGRCGHSWLIQVSPNPLTINNTIVIYIIFTVSLKLKEANFASPSNKV